MMTLNHARRAAATLVAAALTLATLTNAQTRPAQRHNSPVQAGDYAVSGPYTYKNLSVFLLHGRDRAEGQTFLTLSEALATKKVVVYETKSVNELAIENRSDQQVFVQAGDIVKGGQQDRMLSTDLVLPPRSGKVSISSFCVEQGRWTKRGSEASTHFSSSNDRAATKELKLAARKSKSQGEVWQRVEEAQAKLSRNVAAPVKNHASPSSLQLTLENSKVRATADEYVRAFAALADRSPDVVGYAFAINGQINSAEAYASHALFRKLWPGLLKSSAVEAVAELRRDLKDAPAPKTAEVRAFIEDSDRAAATSEGPAGKDIKRESSENVMFETRTSTKSSGYVHRSYIKKQ